MGVDETRRINNIIQETSRLKIFQFFDVDHPANGAITVEVTNEVDDQRIAACLIHYNDADQIIGHRGTPQIFTSGAATAWDVTAITNALADIETLGIAGARAGAGHTADADNPELVDECTGGGSGACAAAVADIISRGDVGGDWGASGRIIGWGASIIPIVDPFMKVRFDPAV